MTTGDADASLAAAIAVVTARLHASEGHQTLADAIAIERDVHQDVGDDLITGLATLCAGLVQFAATLNGLQPGRPVTSAEMLQIVARRLALGSM